MSEWISVKNRLPDGYDDVLVYVVEHRSWWDDEYVEPGKKISTLKHDTYSYMAIQYLDKYEDISRTNITHWMPLPEPPKERE